MAETHLIPYENFEADADGYAPQLIGGGVNAKVGVLTFADEGVATYQFTLPAGATPILWQTNIVTAFNSSGTDLLDIGTADDPDAFANDLDISATGQIPNGYIAAALNVMLTEDTEVVATYTQSVADATAGELQITCIYIVGVGV